MKTKKILAFVTALVMVASMLSTAVFAEVVKTDTNIIDVPNFAQQNYGGSMTINGVLIDPRVNGINGETIAIRVNSETAEPIATYETRHILVNGAFSINVPINLTNFPDGVGNYTVYICYDGSELYNAAEPETKTLNIVKGAATVDATGSDFTYGENKKGYTDLSLSDSLIDTDSLEISYSGRMGTIYPSTTEVPKNVGRYTVAIKIPDSNTNYSGTKSVNFTIARKEVSVTPDDKSVTVNNNVPTFTAKFDGLVDKDVATITTEDDTKFNPEFKLLTTDFIPKEISPEDALKSVGTYTIVLDNKSALDDFSNYKFNVGTGILTVKEPVSAGSSGRSGASSSIYSVKFNSNGGSTVKSVSVTENGKISEPDEPKKNGFIFDGWYTDKELTEKYDFDSKVKKSMTLYAGWIDEHKDSEDKFIMTIGETDANVWGEFKVNDVAPIIRMERTMLPARFVANALGADVEWNEEEQKVTIFNNEILIVINIESDIAYVNGEEVQLDSPAFIENDRTYTPVRFIVESLGANVDWDSDTQQVIITR